jgi:hypothetical protein
MDRDPCRGVVWFSRGRSLESLHHFQECLSWAEKSHEPALIAGAEVRIAATYQEMGDWSRALDAVNRSREFLSRFLQHVLPPNAVKVLM